MSISGSTDGSAQWARSQGVDAIDLAMDTTFTAARARNTGFRHLRDVASDLSYVQFIDGDCELIPDWPEQAISFLTLHPAFGAVCGRRRERFPDQSIYNWMCDREWNGPSGQVRAFGGDVMVRVDALDAVGGYRDELIAGEEPELCLRLRTAGWHIWRLGSEMTLHDAAMTRFGQWWRRTQRSGYAFAQGAHLHGTSPERYRVWESRRAWLWGLCLPLTCLLITLMFEPWGWAIWLIYPLQVLRQTARNQGSLNQRAVLALFQVLARFPKSGAK